MTRATATRAFDVCGPLPTGVTVLEASAGTGKTYTIAALAARYVAEGTPLDRLLLVTFTRIATGELRERVRSRLVGVGLGLERVLAGVAPRGTDEVVALLGQGTPAEVGLRCRRLRRALAHFDAATIATTHGFCQEVLGGLGIAGDLEPETVLAEDISELIDEVVDDLYVRRFHAGAPPPFTRAEAAEIARVVIAHPGAPIVEATGPIPQMRRRLAMRVREELELRKRRLGVLTYDDLLTRLDDTLGGDGGPAAAARLRARYAVVLVDEFQDTDPIQWDIVRRAFGAAPAGGALVLIGDPKQAIYAFRGADVYAYLAAARAAGSSATLDVNWRSDQGLIDAYDAMFGGAKLGHAGIVYRKVRAPPANQRRRLIGAPREAPLGIRVLWRDESTIALTKGGYPSNASAREHIAKDLAADLVGLLSSGAEIDRRDETGRTLDRVAVCPGHAAVLVRTNRHAALIRTALDEVGIPAVINGAGSVFGTQPAREWLRLLEAIERPAHGRRAHAAALTCFVGWSAARIAETDADEWAVVHQRLHDWARVLRFNGVASLTETITLAERLPERILACTDGERRLTDLRHVGQLLHAEASAERLGVTALTAWLRRRIAEADQDTTDEERSRRLESDAEAVQVLTIHRSKGLEFPVVYLPFLWEPGYVPKEPQPVFFHDEAADDALTIDVSLAGDGFAAHRNQSLVEQRGEDLRLAYVALTRAQHQAVVWWAGSWNSRDSPLGRLMFSRDDDGNVAASGDSNPADAAAADRFEVLAAQAPGCIAVERSTLGLPAGWSPTSAGALPLSTAAFDRTLDDRWRRTSYTDITAGAYEARVTSEPQEAVVSDEPARLGPGGCGCGGSGGGGCGGSGGCGGGCGGWCASGAVGGRRGQERLASTRRDAVRRPGRDARPPGARGDRLHGGGSRRRARPADRDGARPAAGRDRRPGRRGGRTPRGDRDAARPPGRRHPPARPAPGRPARRARLRASAGRRRRADRPLDAGGDRRSAAGAPPARGPAGRLRRATRGSGPPAGRPRLPDRQPRSRRPAPRAGRDRAVRGGRLQDEPACRSRRRAGGQRPPPGGARRGDAPCPLRPPGAALRERTPSLSALARARLPGRAQPCRRPLPLPEGDDRAGHADRRRPAVRHLRLAAVGSPRRSPERRPRSGADRVSVLDTPPDQFDVRRATRAPGLLREFNDAGVLIAADVQVARRLAGLVGERDDAVILAAALAVRGPRLGHVLVDLATISQTASVETDDPVDLSALGWPDPATWAGRVAASDLVAVGEDDDAAGAEAAADGPAPGRPGASGHPLRLVGSWLYLDRYWREERQVACDLRALADRQPEGVLLDVLGAGLERLFDGETDERQSEAAESAVRRGLTIVAGGPGTGKTTTVARIVALLAEQAAAAGVDPPLVALAAPTGKAAARLEESVHDEARVLRVDEAIRAQLVELHASTLHRLLGWRPDSRSRFRHNRAQRLPHDVVIVDETSMVSLSMMARLVEAVRPDARLILVGDPGQLASIEAGAVLGDIVGPAGGGTTRSGIVVLDRVHRYGGGIARLAEAIRRGDADGVLEVLTEGPEGVKWIPVDAADPACDGALAPVRELAIAAGRKVVEAGRAGDARTAIDGLGAFRILCAHRRGPQGVATWTARIEHWLAAEIEGFAAGGRWYAGRPLLITENDYELGLYNGDTGVVVASSRDRLTAAFERGGEILELSPTRLGALDTVYAMTIHKSQGSQFDTAAVLLPASTSRILTRELLYTAATRARRELIVVGTEDAVRGAVGRPVARASGLGSRLR